MSTKFVKIVKNARRGRAFSKKFRLNLLFSLFFLLALLLGSAWLVWKQERGFDGSYIDSLWTVLFTLIGQGEFAAAPRTVLGRVVVFLLSIVGVALFGVVFSEILQRMMSSKLREMMGMSRCKYQGHVLICGWNRRAELIIRQLLASGRQIALVAETRPANLPAEVFFVSGRASEKEVLSRGGLDSAAAAIILSDPGAGDDDSRTILTGLAVESLNPSVYSVMELHNPDNERYARFAHVDDIIYTDQLIADITAICTHYEGISSFIRDILSVTDGGHSVAALDVTEAFEGKTIGELFDRFCGDGLLPLGVIVPPEARPDTPVAQWRSRINPERRETVTLPMKVVYIKKD